MFKKEVEFCNSIFKGIPLGVILINSQGRIIYANPKMLEIFEFPSYEKLLNINVFTHKWPMDLGLTEKFRRFLRTGENPVMEQPHKLRSGKSIYLRYYFSQIKEKRGEAIRGMALVEDITAQKNSEIERERLITAIEQSDDEIIITDTAGKMVFVNPAFERITGYKKEEALGKKPSILKSEEHTREFYKDLWDTISNGKVWAGRFTNKKKDGSIYYEQSTISPVRDKSGKIVNYVAVKRDITETLKRESEFQRIERMEAISVLAGGIAHDFNNLLTGMMTNISQLREIVGFGKAGISELISDIEISVNEASSLVKQLLNFSRKSVSEFSVLNANSIIKKVLRLIRPTTPQSVKIKLELDADLKHIEGNGSELYQVIVNIILNSFAAMPSGGELYIKTEFVHFDNDNMKSLPNVKNGERDFVKLTFKDSGFGMDEGTKERIFEPFFTTKAPGKGTGLGLSIAHRIINNHRGWIDVDSKPGEGTSFYIYLPSTEKPLTVHTVHTDKVCGGSETILVADDEELIVNLCKRILSKAGYKIITANDGYEAFEIYRERGKDIDLTLLDLIMPGMGGMKCLARIREINPEAKVIISSGFNLLEEQQNPPSAYPDAYINKPFRHNELCQKVRSVLDSEKKPQPTITAFNP